MKRQINWMILGLFAGVVIVASPYAAEKSGQPGQSSQAASEELKDADVLRGKLLKIEERIYTIETAPGRQAGIRAGKATKFEGDYKGMEGDWIEAFVTPDMHIVSIKKSTPAYTSEGDILKVDRDSLVVKDVTGKETKLQIGKDTQMTGTHKVGERVRAVYTPDGQVLSIKPAKMPRTAPSAGP